MHKGIPLSALAAKIEGNTALKADYIAPVSGLQMTADDDGTIAIKHSSGGTLPLLDIAHKQIGEYAGIPGRYYERMRREAPKLLVQNVNRWFQDGGNDRRMIRTIGGDARAFLSDRYQRIDHEEIAETVLPILADVPGIQIVSAEVTDRRMYLVATTPTIQGEVKVGDIVQAGVMISNSEVGMGAVDISPILYRLICLNGAKVNDARMRRTHVGRRIGEGEDLNAMFADDTRRADDRALLLKIRDVVRGALDTTVFNRTVEKARGLSQAMVTGDPTMAVEMLAKKVGIAESERGGLLRSLIDGGDLSAWSLLNAVTYQAHAATYDRSIELIEAGGALLDLPASEWRTILEAA